MRIQTSWKGRVRPNSPTNSRSTVLYGQKGQKIWFQFFGEFPWEPTPRDLQVAAQQILSGCQLPLPRNITFRRSVNSLIENKGTYPQELETLKHSDWWNHIDAEEKIELLHHGHLTPVNLPSLQHILCLRGIITREDLKITHEDPRNQVLVKTEALKIIQALEPDKRTKAQQPDWLRLEAKRIEFDAGSLRTALNYLTGCLVSHAPMHKEEIRKKISEILEQVATQIARTPGGNQKMLDVIHKLIQPNTLTSKENMPFPSWFTHWGKTPGFQQILFWCAHKKDWLTHLRLRQAGIETQTNTDEEPYWPAFREPQRKHVEKFLGAHALEHFISRNAGEAVQAVIENNICPEEWRKEAEGLQKIHQENNLTSAILRNTTWIPEICEHQTPLGEKIRTEIAKLI
jgi:hypothetical protein